MKRFTKYKKGATLACLLVLNILFWGGLVATLFDFRFGPILVVASLVFCAVVAWGGLFMWGMIYLTGVVSWPPTLEGGRKAVGQIFLVVLGVLLWVGVLIGMYWWFKYGGGYGRYQDLIHGY